MSTQLRRAVESGRYRDALRLFAALRSPTAEQVFLAGRCHLALNDGVRARALLLRSASMGWPRARLDAAVCLRYAGDLKGAWEELSALSAQPQPDQTPDQASEHALAALILREQAVVAEHLVGVQEAIPLAERAWVRAAGASPGVRAAVAEVLARLYSGAGKSLTAQGYLDLALEEAPPETAPYLHLLRASTLTALGRFTEAQQALERVQLLTVPGAPIRSPLAYHRGEWHRVRGELSQAAQAYELAVLRARQGVQRDTECYAQLGLVALAVEQGQVEGARTALSRAQFLAGSDRSRAYVLWRQGTAERLARDPEAASTLKAARTAFGTLGAARERLLVTLHLAEALLAQGQCARQLIREAVELDASLDARVDVRGECRGLPLLTRLLQAAARDAPERMLLGSGLPGHGILEVQTLEVRTLEVRTLGCAELRLDGAPVRWRRRRTFELLVYLLCRGPSPLARLRAELYPDLPAARAKTELHLCRQELRRRVPGLGVGYRPQNGAYGLDIGAYTLVWDVQEWEARVAGRFADQAGHDQASAFAFAGPFLPDFGGEWAASERERMTRWIVRVGLETLDELWRRADYAACLRLAERLLEIEPLESGLHLFLVRATAELHGVRAGVATCRQSAQTFRREVGEVPEELGQLRNGWELSLSN